MIIAQSALKYVLICHAKIWYNYFLAISVAAQAAIKAKKK